jgi:hypothetical protein
MQRSCIAFRRLSASSLAALLLQAHLALGQAAPGLTYSGSASWNAATGGLTFDSSGAMPEAGEAFYWRVPEEVKRIVIASNVTVRGGFRVPFRKADNPLLIAGADRKTSVIFGTDEERWSDRNGIPDNAKWKYGAVSVLADATVIVSNLTSRNPRAYHISGYAREAVLHVSRCDLLDDRPGSNNNSDGFVGANGSTLTDCFISTGDDAIKVYHDITVRNVTVEQHRNGAPLQFGWGGENLRVKAVIEGLTIKGASPDRRYNMAPLTWVAGSNGCSEVAVRGLKVTTGGDLYDPQTRRWIPLALLSVRPPSCTLRLTATDADVGGLAWRAQNSRGRIILNGETLCEGAP